MGKYLFLSALILGLGVMISIEEIPPRQPLDQVVQETSWSLDSTVARLPLASAQEKGASTSSKPSSEFIQDAGFSVLNAFFNMIVGLYDHK
ncbi:hypothetical protein [Pontibacter sp. G13]|uniref:hypothetical protein n=1 Tax=Pontibacter sp. G13 TaxID=3074898 RepID=UPI002888FFC1|nr:hypothetical protein [Pontibacter sp. G13]WNJ16615.1 hypothetical protein RJD25_17255 [Pontibacter sp. G13]